MNQSKNIKKPKNNPTSNSTTISKKFISFNILGYQLIWFLTVWCVQNNMYLYPLISTVLYLVIHFLISEHKRRDLIILLGISIIGSIVDSLLLTFEVFQVTSTQPLFISIPYWLISIWIAFSLLIPYSLNWITTHKITAIMAGAIFGPLAYLSAIKFTILTTSNTTSSLVVLSIIWAILMYIIIKFKEKVGIYYD